VKFLKVEWRDAASTDEWTKLVDIDHELSSITTVGILIGETDETLTIGLSYDHDSESFSNFIRIPKAWIKSRKKLR
jgi:hypothetical protein